MNKTIADALRNGMAKIASRRISEMASKTETAYSYERYGAANWVASIRMLATRGFDDQAIEAILRSKWTRWAGDAANKNEGVTATDLAAYLNDKRNRCTAASVAQLVKESI